MVILTKAGDVVFPMSHNAGGIILKKPVACFCGVVAYFLVNRDGKTRCIPCDAKYEEESKVKP